MSEPKPVRIKARIKEREYAFAAAPGANLLAAALRSKVPVDHICRVGLCGACQVLVLEGADGLSRPTREEALLLDTVPLAEGVRLACQVRVAEGETGVSEDVVIVQ